ncbi:hypothetical protein OPQ81_009332 [Rhizoctonia solani]|nr:hypothetical protein OPQ81_009332 [Rhizoctonia solani]
MIGVGVLNSLIYTLGHCRVKHCPTAKGWLWRQHEAWHVPNYVISGNRVLCPQAQRQRRVTTGLCITTTGLLIKTVFFFIRFDYLYD